MISLFGELVAVIMRATDEEYNRDIGPEAVIATEKANASAEKMMLSMKMLETLAGTLDAKDKYTNGHSMRVAFYATRLAEELGWDKERVSILRYEALLHDIGKIGVPDGLRGTDIPLNARIVCIADAYDAMSSDRIYRKALSGDVIRNELINGRDTQFDPELLDKFYKYMRNIGLRYNHSVEVVQVENIGVVQKRIQFDFDGNETSKSYKLKFTLSNHMDAPGDSKQ